MLLVLSLNKFFGLLRREVHRFCKVPKQTLGTPIISALLYILIFGVSLGNAITTVSGGSYLSFLLPGLIAMALIKNAFENASSSVVASKYVNELQDLRVAPLSKQTIVWALATASLTRGSIVAVLTYLVGYIFQPMPIAHPFLLFFIITLTGLTFGQLGLAVGMRSRTFEQVGSISSFILVPLIYLGGTFFSIDRLAPFWQKVSEFNPIFYIVNAVRYSLLGQADVSIQSSLIVLAITLALSHGVAIYSLKQGTSYSRM